ncbi:uncharacterized protein LOC107607703 [Arachis ipaensis]|uniref:uncharacterized protein LOC107607703 n=1 Tax=Arachis ipaensis TaxID=130454 RepID=UPI000A2B112A|nr:uncharacterized protein LOC107607703 [Arachis ipaensis]
MLSLCSFLLPLLLLLGISLYIFNNIHYSRWDSKVAIDADKRMCSSGWCGRHDIRYPFRLNNSSPSHCGDHRYTLSCENDNQLFLYLKSIKLKVQSINYNNYTIRLVDANVALHTHNHSSLLPYSLTSSNFSRMGYEQYQYRFYTHHFNDGISLIKQMLYVRCPPYGVESSAAASCMNGSYALGSTIYVSDIDKTLQDLAFGDSCQIEWIYLTSWPTEIKHKNISCTDIHHMLLSGFELSWLQAYCNNETFFAMLGDHNNIVCFNNHISSLHQNCKCVSTNLTNIYLFVYLICYSILVSSFYKVSHTFNLIIGLKFVFIFFYLNFESIKKKAA